MNEVIFQEMLNELINNHLGMWYPVTVDNEEGGFFSNISFNWNIMENQDKMIVSQARHIWTLSKSYEIFGNEDHKKSAVQGFTFIKDKMWDHNSGGFYQIRSREGKTTETEKYFDEKRTYGNAFAIYALAALYKITSNEDVLKLAILTFEWIEKKAHDPLYGGYFQFLTREGRIFNQSTEYKTKAKDFHESNFKDQNSSIHLLEAYTELYSVWPDPKLKERLGELLLLIRDKITTDEGYLILFFREDWTPVSFMNASADDRENNYGLDHISFGHDYETAFLMLEASHALNLPADTETLLKGKKMLDHAIENGWDDKTGGFFDEGYYFKDEENCSIIKDTKTWWPQAEGLNVLLLFSRIFPEEKIYSELFEKLWDYTKKYIVDSTNKGWFYGSIEKEPFMEGEPKGNIWKSSYHDGRALMNCVGMLNNGKSGIKGLQAKTDHLNTFINYWKEIAEK